MQLTFLIVLKKYGSDLMIKKIGKNVLFFIILVLFTFFFLLRGQDTTEIFNAIKNIDLYYIFIGIGLMGIYILAESINTYTLLKKLGYKVKLISAIKYTLLGFFYSSITPSSTGGQPMQLYYMTKDKIDISDGTMILLINTCSFQIIIFIYMIFSLIFNYSYLVKNSGYFGILIIVSLIISILVISILLSFIFSKKMTNKIHKLLIFLINKFKKKNREETIIKINEKIERFEHSRNYIKENKLLFIRVLFTTFIQITAFYSVTYITSLALSSSSLQYINILTLQAILYSSVASVPIPGTMGVTEIGFNVLFVPIFGNLVYTATLINRFMNFYVIVLISGFTATYTHLKQK